jgi:hypothetical protein
VVDELLLLQAAKLSGWGPKQSRGVVRNGHVELSETQRIARC